MKSFYEESQLLAVCPFPTKEGGNGIIRMKIKSEVGESTWFEITPDEFSAIEQLLLKRLD